MDPMISYQMGLPSRSMPHRPPARYFWMTCRGNAITRPHLEVYGVCVWFVRASFVCVFLCMTESVEDAKLTETHLRGLPFQNVISIHALAEGDMLLKNKATTKMDISVKGRKKVNTWIQAENVLNIKKMHCNIRAQPNPNLTQWRTSWVSASVRVPF